MSKTKSNSALPLGFFNQLQISHPHWMEFMLDFLYVIIVLFVAIVFAVLASGDQHSDGKNVNNTTQPTGSHQSQLNNSEKI